MSSSKQLRESRLVPLIVILLLTAYQLVRVIAFVNVYGGVEHDGGWALTVARDLAERGDFTTTVSTIVDPSAVGDINIDQKFDIQAPDGRVWFRTGNAIGPASIVPDALVLKTFGAGFWALRAGPLIFYTFFLLLAAYILYQLAGIWSVILFHAFLFFYPHLSIFLSYEALGEVPAMVYTLGAYQAFAMAGQAPGSRPARFFLAGLLGGLAVNAKLVALWSVGGMVAWAGLLWLARAGARIGKRQAAEATLPDSKRSPRFSELLWLAGGLLLIPGLWELVHLAAVNRLAGFPFYLRHVQERLANVLDSGSGIRLRVHSGPDFFWDKFYLLSEVAHPQRWTTALTFVAILAGGLVLFWLWRTQRLKQNLLLPIWLGWLFNTVWFVGLAKTGWTRHFWFGLVLAVMLLCVIAVSLVRLGLDSRRGDAAASPPPTESGQNRWLPLLALPAGVLLLLLIGWGFASQPYVRGFFLPEEIVPYWQQKQINNKYDASLPWMIIPRAAQQEVVEYIEQMPPEAHIYYLEAYKGAEIPPQTGRIQYPIARRSQPGVEPNPDDIILIPSSIISPWRDPAVRQSVLPLIEQACPDPALKNDYYRLCRVSDITGAP